MNSSDRKPRTKRIALWLGCILLAVGGGGGWLGYTLFCPRSAPNQASAIECTLEWGRLAPYPASAQHFTMAVGGTMFTRSFRASFTAPAADIEQWLQQSPGTRDIQASSPSPGIRYFEIAAGGGAVWAEVTVDDINHRVLVYVYWS